MSGHSAVNTHCARSLGLWCFFFFFQAEDGIRDLTVTGVQTCALPIYTEKYHARAPYDPVTGELRPVKAGAPQWKIGRASCRGRVEISVVAVSLKKKKKNKSA